MFVASQGACSIKNHSREVTASGSLPPELDQNSLSPISAHLVLASQDSRLLSLGTLHLTRSSSDRDQYAPRCLPSPASSRPRSPSFTTSPIDCRATTLPSFRELDTFSSLPSPPLDMSGPSQFAPTQPRPIAVNKEYYRIIKTDERTLDRFYPYNNRYMQGEPQYAWEPTHHEPTPVTTSGMAPEDTHRNIFPPPDGCIRPSDSLLLPPSQSSREKPDRVKRPRRRADQVERVYRCNWPDCDKAYGALNHLNTHVRNAEHGAKRVPREFAEIRRELKARRARARESAQSAMYRRAGDAVYHSPQYVPPYEYDSQQHHLSPAFKNNHFLGRDRDPNNSVRYQPYPDNRSGPHGHYERVFSDPFQNLMPASAPEIGRSRWIQDNFDGPRSRHPDLPKDLPLQPHHYETALSQRELYPGCIEDTYEPSGPGVYIQGPNGNGSGMGNKREYARQAY